MTVYTIRKKIAIGFFIMAFLFATPPGLPEVFTDMFLNAPLATYLSNHFGWEKMTSLLYTYTLVPLLLALIGAFIYPADTFNTLKREIIKCKNIFVGYIKLLKKSPINIIWAALLCYILYLVYIFYQTRIAEFLI